MIFLRKLALMTTLALFMVTAHELKLPVAPKNELADSALALGFLLLFAFLAGRLAKLLNAPMITGFLIAGIVAGPFGAGFVTSEQTVPFRLIDDLALTLIAFSAGGELKIDRFRPQLKSILWTMSAQTLFTFALVFITFSIAFSATSFFGQPVIVGIVSAALLGVVATANSPATAMAVITETRSHGPVSDNVIGVTVFKDVFVIALFGLSISVANAIVGETAESGFAFAGHILFEIGISQIVGALAGLIMIGYLKGGDDNVPLFLVGVGLVVVEVCLSLGIKPLLASITAGFVVENYSAKGEKLMEGLRTSSLPIFVLFFSLAGQRLDMDALLRMWPFAIALVLARMAGTRYGSIYADKKSSGGEGVGRFAWTGFIGQAGVSLGFAAMIADQFPGWGVKLSTLIVAGVVVNQVVGPILMKRSLIMAGEASVDNTQNEAVEKTGI